MKPDITQPKFKVDWPLKLIPGFVAVGAAASLWVALQLAGGDFGHSAFLNIALLIWLLLPLAFGAFGGLMAGVLSCKAAVGVGEEMIRCTANWPRSVRTLLVLLAELLTLSVVAIVASAWIIFGGEGPSHYRGT